MLELAIVWMLFFPRRVRIICFFIVTPWEIGVILTANYTFLNYLVLSLGFLLLDDRFVLPLCTRAVTEPLLMRPSNRQTNESELAEPPLTIELKTSADQPASGRIRRTLSDHLSAIRLAICRGDAHVDLLRHDRRR